MSHDPPRMDLDRDVAPVAGKALRLARADAPSTDRLAVIADAVAAQLTVPPDGDSGGSPAPTEGGGMVAKATVIKAGASALAGIVAVGMVVVGVQTTHPAPVASTPSLTSAASVVSASTTAAEEVQQEAPADVAAPLPAVAVTDLPAAVQPKPVPAAADAAPLTSSDVGQDEHAEIAIISAAQRALGSNPSESLRKCNEHAHWYPRGTLAQEREVIAIDALVRLGRRGEAEARSAQFRKAFPRSGHVRRIDAILSP